MDHPSRWMRQVLCMGLAASLCVSGCMAGPREGSGAMLGGMTGLVVGSQLSGGDPVIGIMTGILGAAFGSEIGRELDAEDRRRAERAFLRATEAEVGTTIHWRNRRNHHAGSVRVIREGDSSKGAYCREFQQTVIIGGRQQQAYGTACRQPDGQWKIVDPR